MYLAEAPEKFEFLFNELKIANAITRTPTRALELKVFVFSKTKMHWVKKKKEIRTNLNHINRICDPLSSQLKTIGW